MVVTVVILMVIGVVDTFVFVKTINHKTKKYTKGKGKKMYKKNRKQKNMLVENEKQNDM